MYYWRKIKFFLITSPSKNLKNSKIQNTFKQYTCISANSNANLNKTIFNKFQIIPNPKHQVILFRKKTPLNNINKIKSKNIYTYTYIFPSHKFQNEDILNETGEVVVEGRTKPKQANARISTCHSVYRSRTLFALLPNCLYLHVIITKLVLAGKGTCVNTGRHFSEWLLLISIVSQASKRKKI